MAAARPGQHLRRTGASADRQPQHHEVVSSPLSPWQNPYVERVIGSMRRECLDHVIVLNHRHLRRLLRAYLTYYHRSRTPLGLSKDAPDGRSACAASGQIIVWPEVGSLHHRYDRQAT